MSLLSTRKELMHYSDFPINLFGHIYLITLMLSQEMTQENVAAFLTYTVFLY